ncbi:MAG: sigma-70 family RNA polymerase sigma factor [Deltaproteobacteria bacterium]|nr:sigma-70 family RNA polymerase sigma factor [Deltaproteobacteria bacterium]
MNPDEERLVGRARRGEPAAFREIVESFQGRILRTVAGITGDREEARDLTQEAFLKAFEALDAFKGGSSLHTWLYRIAVNLCIDQLRGRRKRPLLFDLYDPACEESPAHERMPDSGVEDPLENTLRREKAVAIQGALDQLSPDHRAIIILREVEGLSYEEIASVLGIGLGTVMSRLYYARAHLRDALASYVREGEGSDEETIRVLQPVPKKA